MEAENTVCADCGQEHPGSIMLVKKLTGSDPEENIHNFAHEKRPLVFGIWHAEAKWSTAYLLPQ